MTDKLEEIWKEAVIAESIKYSGICLQDLRKPRKTSGE
jgi:hypothetical protein